MLENWRE